MALLADTAGAVIGVDTHAGTHTACLADRLGRQLAVITIAADPGGCRRLLAWARRHAPGPRLAWSVEGTRSHGLGLTRYLHAHGQLVTEAGRPERASRRPGGEPDPADAARAGSGAGGLSAGGDRVVCAGPGRGAAAAWCSWPVRLRRTAVMVRAWGYQWSSPGPVACMASRPG